MDAISLLIRDHKNTEDLFVLYEAAATAEDYIKDALARKITSALTVHMQIEEELFYPKAREVLDDANIVMVDEAETEHLAAKKLIETIYKREPGARMDVLMKALKAAIEHHVEEEEMEMFPRLQHLGMETKQLGAKMAARKSQLMPD